MALLDVSEILGDPDFSDVITVYRRVQTVGANGRATVSETAKVVIAVVTQAGGDVLDRLPEGAIIEGSITVHTTEPLVVSNGSRDADEVLYAGRRYIVSSVSDYSNFGSGFTAATCTLKPISP